MLGLSSVSTTRQYSRSPADLPAPGLAPVAPGDPGDPGDAVPFPDTQPMLLICQPAAPIGSHPFFSSTVIPAGTPADTPHRCAGSTRDIRPSSYDWAARDSTPFDVVRRPSSRILSRAVTRGRPQYPPVPRPGCRILAKLRDSRTAHGPA